MTDAPPTGAEGHPGISIAVYKVDGGTGERGPVTERTHLRSEDAPLLTGVWPPCRCPRHRDRDRDRDRDKGGAR